MADILIAQGSFGTASPLIIGAAVISSPTELRFAFTITANPGGFVFRSTADDPKGVGFLITGTGVKHFLGGEFRAGNYVFSVEPQGGAVSVSSFSIFIRDTSVPEPGEGPGREVPIDPPIVDPPLKVIEVSDESGQAPTGVSYRGE
jgi:hypothetical protein